MKYNNLTVEEVKMSTLQVIKSIKALTSSSSGQFKAALVLLSQKRATLNCH